MRTKQNIAVRVKRLLINDYINIKCDTEKSLYLLSSAILNLSSVKHEFIFPPLCAVTLGFASCCF